MAKKFKCKQHNDADIGTDQIKIKEEKIKISSIKNHLMKMKVFFSLPHIRTLTPQKKILQTKTQELVYSFVYECQQPNKENRIIPQNQNIQAYETNPHQIIQTIQDYSNPESVGSYLTNFLSCHHNW